MIVMGTIEHIKPVVLPEHELKRSHEITNDLSRACYLAGRYLVRGVLAKWLKRQPEEIAIELSDTGKPFLPQLPYHFSITHSEELVAAVFSTQPAGIDLEKERFLDVGALAQRFFSAEEAKVLAETQSLTDFFRWWCCREAAIKADGRGLGALLSDTRVMLPATEECVQVGIGERKWSVFPWILEGGIHGAVALQKPPRVIRWCDLDESLG